jgi:hypothetical protein
LYYNQEELNKLLTKQEEEKYKDEISKLKDGFLVELKPGTILEHIPQNSDIKGYYQTLLDTHPNSEAIKQTETEEKLGLRYSFYKNTITGQIKFHVETEDLINNPLEPNNPIRKFVTKGEDWNTLPPNVSVDDKIKELQNIASKIYIDNSGKVAKIIPPVPSISLAERNPKIKELETKLNIK